MVTLEYNIAASDGTRGVLCGRDRWAHEKFLPQILLKAAELRMQHPAFEFKLVVRERSHG